MATLAGRATGASEPVSYVWEDPGDSIMIQVSLDLVERLGAAVEAGLGTGSRGIEIGGILLGRALTGFGRAVLIEDFELVSCEHLRGSSYTLSPGDKRQFGTRLARHPARRAVGYFRSHTRPGMYLDQDDFAIFSRFFPEAWQVALLVRPSRGAPAMAGFFFWEEGDVNRRSTYREFPFDATQLLSGGFPVTGGEPVPAPSVEPAAVSAKPVSAKVESDERQMPVILPKPRLPKARKLPALPWVVVPVIAILFIIAGLFVSENQTSTTRVAATKPVPPPVEPLLPKATPAPPPAAAEPASIPPEIATAPASGAAPSGQPATEVVAAKPQVSALPAPTAPASRPPAAPKPTLSAKSRSKPPAPWSAPPRIAAARVSPHEVDQPPDLSTPVEKLEPKLPAVFRSYAGPPPPVAEVSYEAPRPGVLRRAFRKIEGADPEAAGFVAASPIRKIAPMKPARADGDARLVDVKVFIDESGNVTRVQVLGKSGELAKAAVAAARQWQFSPARKHDKPVASEMVLHFQF